jgi:phosphatidylserine/phosphatidylglycerophosphate/cardiolipin synthase-like enzyme
MSDSVEVVFPKLGHFWLDSGLIGLYKIAIELTENNPSYSHMKPIVADDKLVFSGNPSGLKDFLWNCSKELMDRFFNSSSKKQREKAEAIIFSQANKRLVTFKSVCMLTI